MSESYRAARRSYAVSSGLLLAWETVGLRLGSQNLEESSHVTGEFLGLPMRILTPEGVPYVVLSVTAYLAVRFTIEWYRLGTSQRGMVALQVDRYLAHGLATAATMLFAVQRVREVQLLNIEVPTLITGLLAAIFVAAVSLPTYAFLNRRSTLPRDYQQFAMETHLFDPVSLTIAALAGSFFGFVSMTVGQSWTVADLMVAAAFVVVANVMIMLTVEVARTVVRTLARLANKLLGR